MIPALILLAVLVVFGGALYIHHRLTGGDNNDENPTTAAADTEECCGMHITCERDSLLASMSSEIVYYDDEELDAYAGRAADQYTAAEVEQFREILLTLQPEDIAGWARSVQLRGITLPSDIRDELLLIVAENRMESK
jgi:uncharacterized protein YpmS